MSSSPAARPRIGVVSALHGADRESASGTPWSMAQALQRHVGDVVHLGPSRPVVQYAGAAVDRLSRAVIRKRYDFRHSVLTARGYAGHFDRAIERERPDLLFAPKASAEAAYLRSTLPLIYWSDATPRRLAGYYPEWRDFLALSIREMDRLERRTIARADALVYPTRWVAESAVEAYGADPARISIVGPGPNLWPLPDRGAIPVRTATRDDCRLLFVAVSWERKGGPIALETLAELRSRGIAATLTICGIDPPGALGVPGVRVVGRLRKNVDVERRILEQELGLAHFLLLPTRAECFSIAICEASAYALPSITTATGGVGGVLQDGVNGFALPLDAGAEDYASTIERVVGDPALYRALADGSRRLHEEYLSWDVWGSSVARAAARLLSGSARTPAAAVDGAGASRPSA